MLKKIGIISTFCFVWSTHLFATLQTIVVPAHTFYQGTSLVLIACDGQGIEKVACCVPYQEGKTEYSEQEILKNNPTLCTIHEHQTDIVADLQGQVAYNADDALIYLYFELDESVQSLRVIVIKNSFLADNPFDIVQVPFKSLILPSIEDDEDTSFDLFDDEKRDDDFVLPPKDQEIIVDKIELTLQEKAILITYVLWEYQLQYTKSICNAMLAWCKSKYAE